MTPKLVIFDCDGTLVDSQHAIVASMTDAFAAEGLTPPSREATVSVVGLSLEIAIARLVPEDTSLDGIDRLFWMMNPAKLGAALPIPS